MFSAIFLVSYVILKSISAAGHETKVDPKELGSRTAISGPVISQKLKVVK